MPLQAFNNFRGAESAGKHYNTYFKPFLNQGGLTVNPKGPDRRPAALSGICRPWGSDMTEFHLLVLISVVMLLIGATARSYLSLVVQTLAVTLCFVAMKRYVLEVPEHVAPEVLGPFLDGVAAALGDFFTFLIWSRVW